MVYILWKLATDPGGSIQHLTDPVALGVPRQEVRVVQEGGHLGHSEASDGFNPNCHIQHLRGDKVPVPSAFKPRQLHQNADVPIGRQRNTSGRKSWQRNTSGRRSWQRNTSGRKSWPSMATLSGDARRFSFLEIHFSGKNTVRLLYQFLKQQHTAHCLTNLSDDENDLVRTIQAVKNMLH